MSVAVYPTLLRAAWALALLVPIAHAQAQCTVSEVMELAENGSTVTEIAEECEISKREVNKILKSRDGADRRPPKTEVQDANGAPPGTPLAPCACWGAVAPTLRQPAAACASGFAQPQMCNIACPMGGYAWRGVCL